MDNSSNKSILYVLLTIYLIFRKTTVRVTVVKLGVYDGGGNCFRGVKVKVCRPIDTAESTNVILQVLDNAEI